MKSELLALKEEVIATRHELQEERKRNGSSEEISNPVPDSLDMVNSRFDSLLPIQGEEGYESVESLASDESEREELVS